MVSPTECPDNSAVRVLAYTLGEEDFTDNNGDGYFSEGDTNADAEETEPYLDSNSNSEHDVGEFFVDWNKNEQHDQSTTITPLMPLQAPSKVPFYNGTACVAREEAMFPIITDPPAGPVEDDDCTNQLIYVWDDVMVNP